MLQNDIGKTNENDMFIVPVTSITPGAGNPPTSPLSPQRTRHRGASTSVPTPDHAERGGERFISYPHFLSRYWNDFPYSLTRGLGVCTKCPAYSISNRGR